MTVRNYLDNTPTTALTSAITAGATSATVNSLTGFPVSFPYTVTLGLGTASAEVVLVTAAVGSTVTITRNYDGQGAFSHPINETFDHTAVAKDYQEANSHVNASTAVHGIAGAVVGTTDTQTLSAKTLTSPTVSGTVAGAATYTSPTLTGATLDAASTHGGVSGTSLAADRTAWTTYTPTFTNITSGAGQFAYKQIGKTLHIRGTFTGGTVAATAPISVSLPAGLTAAGAAGVVQYVIGETTGGSAVWLIGPGTTSSTALGTQSNQGTGNGLTGCGFTGVIEVQ